MGKVILQDVEMWNSTCLLYALNRIGMGYMYPIEYEDLFKSEDFQVMKFQKDKLKTGDLIVWSSELEKQFMPNSVINNEIISNKITRWVHYAVYEGKGYVTDCFRTEEGSYPAIKKYTLNDRNRATFILRRNA
ncbi:MAG: hypothetical protein GY714_14895 [Desulfobacterales bacterium]|nr:hypothetical protein [Desulfobacterales bacterium]MCP4164017.1 hypothetical protein [Deltaproteobacteria bacterium]